MTTYPSAVDRWIAVALAAAPVGLTAAGIALSAAGAQAAAPILAAGIGSGIVLLAVLPCRYSLAEDHLLVRAGLLRWRIPYHSISEASPTRSPVSGPALSLDRLRIRHRNGTLLISPVRRDSFLGALEERVRKAGGKLRKAPRDDAGAKAERYAAGWLHAEKGFRILVHNWRHKRDELDIIARDGKSLVFVEVRARKAGALVPGYHSVNRRKKEALRRCALAYLRQCRPSPDHFRFDIVEVELINGNEIGTLRHFERVPVFRKTDRPTHS